MNLNPFRREIEMQKNDICIHLFSRFGRVKSGLVHQRSNQKTVAYPISYDQMNEIMNVNSWLEVAAIVRKGER